MKEIWKDIKGYEGRYQVSNIGNVRSVIRGKLLAPQPGPYGYLRVPLQTEGKQKYFPVHILVYEAFFGERHAELDYVVDHKNNNKLDNRASNLQLLKDADNLRKDRHKKSGLPRGVYYATNGGYYASIYRDKKHTYLGCFKTVKEAENAYKNAKEALQNGDIPEAKRSRFFIEDGYKICTCCGERKSITEFYKQGKGYSGRCRDCLREYDYNRRHAKKK